MFLMIEKSCACLHNRKFDSCNDTSEATSCKFEIRPPSLQLINFTQCIVGDSSTVCHGGSYLKKWLAWLEGNADVKYAGLE